MPLVVTNTLSGKKEPFVPMEPGKVKLYVCGPTVYGLTHVGNARPVVVFDVVRRYLQSRGYEVFHVSNYTDVDDKIIRRAKEEGISTTEVTEKYIRAVREDMAALGVLPPHERPRVTDFIPQIVAFIEGLVKKGAAYVTEDGAVLFSVRTFASYGKLSGKKIDELLSGVRIEADEKKRDPLDFALWKPRKEPTEPAWPSPWGEGRPGWHIECSAMALELMGETFDIHGGGLDLQHPHHENEIAQSEALTGKPFVHFWLHNNFVSMGDTKMSKSLGNMVLNRDFLTKYAAETLKYLLIAGHYRSPIDFSEASIARTQSSLHRIYTTLLRADRIAAGTEDVERLPSTEENRARELGDSFQKSWREAMDDDFNTARAVALVFDYLRATNAMLDKQKGKASASARKEAARFGAQLRDLGSVLNLFLEPPAAFLEKHKERLLAARGLDRDAVEAAVVARTEARQSKDFARADGLRDEWLAKGVEFRDGPQGTEWDIVVTDA